jgi:hypothetical protein
MRNAKLYRQYAAECRRIARTMRPDQKAKLLEIADAWEACARDAEKDQAGDDEEPALPVPALCYYGLLPFASNCLR